MCLACSYVVEGVGLVSGERSCVSPKLTSRYKVVGIKEGIKEAFGSVCQR